MNNWIEYTNRKCWTITWLLPDQLKQRQDVLWKSLIEGKKLFESFFDLVCIKSNLLLIYGSGLIHPAAGFKAEVVLKQDAKSTELKEFLHGWGIYDCKVFSKCKTLDEENEWLKSSAGNVFPIKLKEIIFPFPLKESDAKLFELYNQVLRTNHPDPAIFVNSYVNENKIFFNFDEYNSNKSNFKEKEDLINATVLSEVENSGLNKNMDSVDLGSQEKDINNNFEEKKLREENKKKKTKIVENIGVGDEKQIKKPRL